MGGKRNIGSEAIDSWSMVNRQAPGPGSAISSGLDLHLGDGSNIAAIPGTLHPSLTDLETNGSVPKCCPKASVKPPLQDDSELPIILEEPPNREATVPYYNMILNFFAPSHDLLTGEHRPGSAEESLPLADKYYPIPDDRELQNWRPDLELIDENLAEFMRLPVAIGFNLKCIMKVFVTRLNNKYFYLTLENETSHVRVTMAKAFKKGNKQYRITTDVSSHRSRMIPNKDAVIGKTSRKVASFATYNYDYPGKGHVKLAKLCYVTYTWSWFRKLMAIIRDNPPPASNFAVAIPAMVSESKRVGEDTDTHWLLRTGAGVIHLRNKQPVKGENGTYKHNMVDLPKLHVSMKNFQLIYPGEDDYIILQLGKIGDNDYSLHIRYPLSPLQAFGIALSRFTFNR